MRDLPQDKQNKQKQQTSSFQKKDIRHVTDDEWADFENYYIEKVNEIVIPEDLTPRDILEINAQIDEVYGEARFDYAFAKSQLAKWEQRLSNAKKNSKLIFTKMKGQTNEDREALITTFLETHALKGDPAPLYTLVERWTERALFMEAVIDNLLKKSDKMVNGNGALKLDAQGRGDVGKGHSK